MQRIIYLIAIAIAVFSCNSPLDKKYNEKTLDEDAQAIRDQIDTTETAILLGTVLRYKFQGKKLEEKTYGELLEEGRKFKEEQDKIEAEQKALAEKAKKEEEEKARRLNESLTVTVFNKGFVELDYEEYITFQFAFQNKTEKDILAFTGIMIFNDLFDVEISKLSITYDNGVKANSTVNWRATTDYNQFRDSDKTLRYKELNKIKLVWKPEKIIFNDGTSLE